MSGTQQTASTSPSLFPRYARAMTVYDTGVIAESIPIPARIPISVSDADLLINARAALIHESDVPDGQIALSVSHGIVTLDGCTDCYFKRAAAEHAVRFVRGIRDVDNRIVVQSVGPTDRGAMHVAGRPGG